MRAHYRTHKAVEEVVTGNIVFRHKRPLCGDPWVPLGRMARDWRKVNCERCKRIHKERAEAGLQAVLWEPEREGLMLVANRSVKEQGRV